MMSKCKNCKWWKKPGNSKEYNRGNNIIKPVDPDTCEPMEMPFEVRYCSSPGILFCERPVKSNGATVVDGSGYMADFITAPNFGCVLFEDKNENDY